MLSYPWSPVSGCLVGWGHALGYTPLCSAWTPRTAVETLGIPCFLGGMARGLLGRNHPLHIRQNRSAALKKADVVLLAGGPRPPLPFPLSLPAGPTPAPLPTPPVALPLVVRYLTGTLPCKHSASYLGPAPCPLPLAPCPGLDSRVLEIQPGKFWQARSRAAWLGPAWRKRHR